MKSIALIFAAASLIVVQETVYQPGNGVRLPQVVKEAKAQYTQQARDAHIEGIVLVAAVVRADGTVGDVKVERSLDPTYGLDEAAANATKEWTFKPGTKDGKAVAVEIHISHSFTLK